jgi:predicted lipid-binding transport protein (Tim44 family)
MNGQIDLITLISLIVAVVAILKLRSVLGSRTDEDDARVERMKAKERAAAEAGTGDVINMPARPRDDVATGPVEPADDGADAEGRIRAYPAADAGVTAGLLEIARLDSSMDPDAFVRGAGRAYEMIVSAFAEGDRKGLKDLLSREVYDGFAAAIAEREGRGEIVEQQFVGIKKADIVEAEVKSGNAYITVKFLSELISATRDKDGIVLSGDPQRIKEVTDIWTFSRDVSTVRARSNPNWRLVATQAPN